MRIAMPLMTKNKDYIEVNIINKSANTVISDELKIADDVIDSINKYLNISVEDKIAYVMEKPNPVEFRNKLKDGIHIIFPNIIIANNAQHFIRRKIIDIGDVIFKDLPICNDYESIVDKAIIDVNCWQMYGSKKPDLSSGIVKRKSISTRKGLGSKGFSVKYKGTPFVKAKLYKLMNSS